MEGTHSFPIPKTTTPETRQGSQVPCLVCVWPVFACKLRFTRQAGQRLRYFHFQAHFRTQRMASVDFSAPGGTLSYPPALHHCALPKRYHGTRGTLSTNAREIQRHSERASPPAEKSHDVVLSNVDLPYSAVAAIHPSRNCLPVSFEASQCLGLSSKCQTARQTQSVPLGPGTLGPS
ncbi:hypothetical protein B0T09DRAFT_362865 [Sordaria sp. MPI-SDFR-AT-0083]|nr:hypothetical protein B0T09DRAFT_362865 [Sordaria sp. MPI-SDFR-AT-0083]